MKLVAATKADQNQAWIDPWSAVHFGTGLGMGLMMLPLRWVLVGAVTYEVIEQVVERQHWGKRLFETSGPESLGNVAVDLLLIGLGHGLGVRWNRTGPAKHR